MTLSGLFRDPEEAGPSATTMLRFLPCERAVDVAVTAPRFAEGAGAAFAPHFFRQTLASNTDEVHLLTDGDRREVDRSGDDVPVLVMRQQQLVHGLVDATRAVGLEHQSGAKLPPAAARMLFGKERMQPGVADGDILVERDDRESALEAPLQSQRLGGQKGRLFRNPVRQAFVDLIGKFLGLLRLDRDAVPNSIRRYVHLGTPYFVLPRAKSTPICSKSKVFMHLLTVVRSPQ